MSNAKFVLQSASARPAEVTVDENGKEVKRSAMLYLTGYVLIPQLITVFVNENDSLKGYVPNAEFAAFQKTGKDGKERWDIVKESMPVEELERITKLPAVKREAKSVTKETGTFETNEKTA